MFLFIRSVGFLNKRHYLCLKICLYVSSVVCSKVVLFMFRKVFLKIFLQVPFFFVLTSRTRFRFTNSRFFINIKWRRPLLYQLFINAVYISTMWTQTKWSWDLRLTNDKASYVAKEDSICLLSVAKEATLNEQWIKPGVPNLYAWLG